MVILGLEIVHLAELLVAFHDCATEKSVSSIGTKQRLHCLCKVNCCIFWNRPKMFSSLVPSLPSRALTICFALLLLSVPCPFFLFLLYASLAENKTSSLPSPAHPFLVMFHAQRSTGLLSRALPRRGRSAWTAMTSSSAKTGTWRRTRWRATPTKWNR